MIEIDGSYLEGGGQIVRTALALSTLTGKSFIVKNIRKGRKTPGLKNQHLFGVNALKELCNANVNGNTLGSEYLEYTPGKIDFHNLNIDIGTAGSVTLLLQAILPVVMFADDKIKLQITGGTDTEHSMPVDYFVNVFLPHLRGFADFEAIIEKRGYYPKGGGKLVLRIKPKYSLNNFASFAEFFEKLRQENKKINLFDQGKLQLIKGISHASKDLMKAEVADRQARSARYALNNYGIPVKIDTQYNEAFSTGSGITLWALFSDTDEIDFNNPVILGADALGERGKKSESVGEEAAHNLIKEIESKAAVDYHLADQILPFMALFGGKILASEISEHCKTNIYVIEKFLDVKFIINGNLITTNK